MDYESMSNQELIDALTNNDVDALPEACSRCGYSDEYKRREQVIDGWPHDYSDYDRYTHQGLINYTDSILMDLCLEWLRHQVAAPN